MMISLICLESVMYGQTQSHQLISVENPVNTSEVKIFTQNTPAFVRMFLNNLLGAIETQS